MSMCLLKPFRKDFLLVNLMQLPLLYAEIKLPRVFDHSQSDKLFCLWHG
jgi:hypothetical protein